MLIKIGNAWINPEFVTYVAAHHENGKASESFTVIEQVGNDSDSTLTIEGNFEAVASQINMACEDLIARRQPYAPSGEDR